MTFKERKGKGERGKDGSIFVSEKVGGKPGALSVGEERRPPT